MQSNRLIPELNVRSIEESLAFYVDKLGFRVDFARAEDRFAQVSLEGAQLMLEEDHPTAWLTGLPDYPRGRGINFQIEVNSLQVMVRRVVEHNISYFRPPKENWYRIDTYEEGVLEFLIQDPDGYLLRFQQYLGQRYT